MSLLLLIRPEAEQDLMAARDWYDRQRAGLGDEFLDAVALAMIELERDAERRRLYFRDFRRIVLRRFPYKVFYQVMGDRVVVFRVLHASREYQRSLSGG